MTSPNLPNPAPPSDEPVRSTANLAEPQPTLKRPEKAAVIRRMQGAEETSQERFIKKHLPAWVVSGVVHLLLVGSLIATDSLMGQPVAVVDADSELTVVAQTEEKPAEADLLNPDVGLDPQIITAIDAEKLDDINVKDVVQAQETPGIQDATSTLKQDFIPAPGGLGVDSGVLGDTGNFMGGLGGGGFGTATGDPFIGRGAATRSKMLAQGGGNNESEAAVARGLIWLIKQQKADGSWEFDGNDAQSKQDRVAATGLALLPLLAAGQTHKSTAKDNRYRVNVKGGLRYLLSMQQGNGSFKTSTGMYSHAIVTIALCELLGMTKDKSLVTPAQKAVNYILTGQGANGSWGYKHGTNGDTSIVGWQIQALQSAKLCKELNVDKRVIEKSLKFLDSVSVGSNKALYGYNSPMTKKTMVPVGLLCRYYVGGWGPQNPGMAEGVKYLMKTQQPSSNYRNYYYYYYATQVMHFVEGEEWYKYWNPAMRDLLIKTQTPLNQREGGSWEEDDELMGRHCGRLGATCLSLLTLEVYYRHLPLYKRDTSGLRELERAK